MAAVPTRFIPELLEIHAEELEYLWGQRRTALTSPEYTAREFVDLNGRLEAHVQGLLAVPQALPELLYPFLESDERDAVFAAAYPLLRLDEVASVSRVLEAFGAAEGSRLAGLRDAFSMYPNQRTTATVEAQFAGEHEGRAVAAAVVLANRRRLESGSTRLDALLKSEDPPTATLAWRVVPLVDTREAATARPFEAAIRDGAPPVRDAAFAAAAWTGQPWLLKLVRHLAASGDRLAVDWLAVLGTAEDLPFMLRCGRSPALGKDRCPLLARYGHPQAIELALEWMEDDDLAIAEAAGQAFARITGIDVRGERRTLPVADDADDFAREFAPDVWLPDARRARALWEQHKSRWQSGSRWRRGFDLTSGCSREVLGQLDLESRWEVGARAAVAGQRIMEPAPIFC